MFDLHGFFTNTKLEKSVFALFKKDLYRSNFFIVIINEDNV